MTERLSPNFFLHEFTRSNEAARAGIVITPTIDERASIKRLCGDVMEPVRKICDDRAITILSGLRPVEVNRLANGSRNSDHILGNAADFIVAGLSPYQVCKRIAARIQDLPIKQLILEFNQWTHVSICRLGEEPRRQILTAHYVNGVRTYTAGFLELRVAA